MRATTFSPWQLVFKCVLCLVLLLALAGCDQTPTPTATIVAVVRPTETRVASGGTYLTPVETVRPTETMPPTTPVAQVATATTRPTETVPPPTGAPVPRPTETFPPATVPPLVRPTETMPPPGVTPPPTWTPTATRRPTETRPPATPTRRPTETWAALPSPTSSQTPGSGIQPGVYVTRIRVERLNPGAMPAQFVFHAAFNNTTGAPQSYLRWRAMIYRLGATKSFGEIQGQTKTIPAGQTEQDTGAWQVRVFGCENYSASLFWDDDNGDHTLFLDVNGAPETIAFQVCP